MLTALAIAAVRHGVPGLELSALRQSPRLATSLGVRLGRRRLGAFAASAFVAGLAGALSVQLAAVADPTAYDPFLSFKLLVAVLLGGAAATLGPAAGVAALGLIGLVAHPLARVLQLPLDRFDTAVAAILLVFVLALGGGGIVPWLEPYLARFRKRRRPRPQVTSCYKEGGAGACGEAVLRAVELRKAFGGVVALDGLSFDLARGETVALVGPNGSGKTTALRLISGAESPDSGRVLFEGRALTDEATPERVRLGVARAERQRMAWQAQEGAVDHHCLCLDLLVEQRLEHGGRPALLQGEAQALGLQAGCVGLGLVMGLQRVDDVLARRRQCLGQEAEAFQLGAARVQRIKPAS